MTPPEPLLRSVPGLAAADEEEQECAARRFTQGVHAARQKKRDAIHAALQGKPRVRVKAICVRIASPQVSVRLDCNHNGYALHSWPSQRNR